MNDKAIQEIRSIRHRISEEFDHDPQQYIDYLNNQNAKYKRQIELYRKLCEREAVTLFKHPGILRIFRRLE